MAWRWVFPKCSLRRAGLALRWPGRRGSMVQRVTTVAFEGIEARAVDVQVQVAPGLPHFAMVGLPDKAVSEARERVRSALVASGLALPARRITVNLAPADVPKEGSHYDLPIALGLMAAIGAVPSDALSGFTVLGELGLDGSIAAVAGVLPAAIGANGRGEGLICPAVCGAEAAWASPEMEIVAAASLIQLANHFRGTQVLARPQPKIREVNGALVDLKDIKGQESAKRALEVAAAGGHNLLMVGPPGAGKSMLAARLPTILPPLTPAELLEVSMIASVAGEIEDGALTNRRPFRAPHHSASMPALVGGGLRARPGCALRRRLSGAPVGPADRPHRPHHRGAGGDRRRPHPAAAGGRKPRGRRARRARPRAAGRALCRDRPSAGAGERGRARPRARGRGAAGCRRAGALTRGGRRHAALRARLSPGAAGGAHPRRPRRRRAGLPRASRRGAVLSHARRRGQTGGLSARRAKRNPRNMARPARELLVRP